jgi:hypothetical protein
MSEYEQRKALSVEAAAGIFLGATLMILGGMIAVWLEWWLV